MADSKVEYSALAREDSIDLEGLPDTDAQNIRHISSRRRFTVAIVLLVLPTFFLSLPSFGVHPLKCMSHLPAERPAEMSMCDYYATKNHYWNSARTQKKLVRAIVDTAFLGIKASHGVAHDSGAYNGILRAGDYFEAKIDLTTYFDGSRNTTNVKGKATNVNFFSGRTFTKDGHEYPAGNCKFHHMKEGMYKYTASMLGCSVYGNTVDRYAGTRSLQEIHKFMDFSQNWDWMYFIKQIQLGTIAAGQFSYDDAGMFELYLVDKFGPKIDKANKKTIPAFANPELGASVLPPKFDAAEIKPRVGELVDLMTPKFAWKEKREVIQKKDGNEEHINDNAKRVTMLPDRVQRRQDFSSTPPPLTTPVLAPQPSMTTRPSNTPEASAEPVPSNILPIALGAGIGAAVGVIIIATVIAYFVIRKKKIEKRQSMPGFIKPAIEMQKGHKTGSVNRRVDRSEHGNVVGKPKDYQPPKEEGEVVHQEKPKGHKKNESTGVRSVRFSQQEL
ncbi:hypothetical protein H072_367 [Dactylellina haptotyla CBS 200.50]|uniref:Uncharacterized protein n=1 Tax=Dactylellina haptotyla (strain CBS 200.50) TaxID=1284197 RepID=S8ARM1_DACHA|nr:hypothetical protein H072_367 [Dactylellina haptotyla CBS 200.50]